MRKINSREFTGVLVPARTTKAVCIPLSSSRMPYIRLNDWREGSLFVDGSHRKEGFISEEKVAAGSKPSKRYGMLVKRQLIPKFLFHS
jgi:hypothetical protein